ncbi:hypothetical protein chiPu_0028885 [Chiloscyllium punctatum]|uniref:Uncharacterized protein n=1 Tax=Chiloscyllium punctatum TaxID=137246 RepID=A0A401TQ25_CHIPU|nr:hypothetical protein [Chiloscyllium punctatum]
MDWREWDMEDEEELQFYLELSCEDEDEEVSGLLQEELGGGQQLTGHLLLVPAPERMSQVLDETLGPLPVLAPVRKFRRQPAGHYDASTDVQELFGKRRAANARERHRVRTVSEGNGRVCGWQQVPVCEH